MTALRRKAETRYCPAGAHTVPKSHMEAWDGEKRVPMDTCKSCACSSRMANDRAQMAVHQGRRG